MSFPYTDTYTFRKKLDTFPDQVARWYFVRVPKGMSVEIRALHGHRSRGFSSLRVLVAVGESEWNTSLFYDSKDESYLLFIKAAVRKAEGIDVGDSVKVNLRLLFISAIDTNLL